MGYEMRKEINKFKDFLKENLNESNVNDIFIKIEDKNKDTYNFISKYLDVISFNDYISNDNLYQAVARKGDEIVGVRIFRMKDGKIHLNYSAITERERNKGLNRKLLKVIEDFAIKNGVNIMTSNVRKSNLSSLNSLLKSDFIINKNYDLYYPDGEKKIPLFKKL
jgi:ribosomal protein S18 acetylase RimI-like enzyme